MNETALGLNASSASSLAKVIQIGLPVAYAAGLKYPAVAKAAQGVFSTFLSGVTGAADRAVKTYQDYAPDFIKRELNMVGPVVDLAGTVALKSFGVLVELTDFANMGGTKDPELSIIKSRTRLNGHDQNFSEAAAFIADQAANSVSALFQEKKAGIREKIQPYLDFTGFGSIFGDFFDLLAGSAKNLIAQTVKANILHIFANLADEGFDPNHPFADQQRNPFGRILSVVTSCFNIPELSLIDQLPEDQRPETIRRIFQGMATDLLGKLFPKGADDIQLFHHTFPGIKLVKEFIWSKLNEKLPGWLQQLYRETRPLAETNPAWEQQFDAQSQGLKAAQMVKLPSSIYNHYLKDQVGPRLIALRPKIESALEEQGVARANHLSSLVVKYAGEFLLTQDPQLVQAGSFVERYFMERILSNMTNFKDPEDETPLLQYILQHWLSGDVFKMASNKLSCNAAVAEQAKAGAISSLLAPFGLNQQDTFPLPALLKDKLWPMILKFRQEKLPDLIVKCIPEFAVVLNHQNNEKKLEHSLGGDSSLIRTLQLAAYYSINRGLDWAADANLNIFQKLNAQLPGAPLSIDQQNQLAGQLDDFLADDNQSLYAVLDFSQTFIEAFVFQICNDLYDTYTDTQGLQNLFEDNAFERNDSFASWLLNETFQAFKDLSLEQMSEVDFALLKRGVELKNLIRKSQDPEQKKNYSEELRRIWPLLQPKFELFSQKLLKLLGYDHDYKLPLPKPLQKTIWGLIQVHLPKVMFEQMGDLVLPLVEKERLKTQIEQALPHGNEVTHVCRSLAEDIIDHLPELVESQIDQIPQKIQAKLPGAEINEQTVDLIKSFILQEDPNFDFTWDLITDYVEAILLKFSAGVSSLSCEDLTALKTLVQQSRPQLMIIEEFELPLRAEEERRILAEFTDLFFARLGMQSEDDLFGVPVAARKALMAEVKKRFAQVVVGLYRFDQRIRFQAKMQEPIDSEVPLSTVAKAALALTRFALDAGTDVLSAKKDGQLKLLPQAVQALNKILHKQTKNGWQIAELFKDAIAKDRFTPALNSFFELLDDKQAIPYKDQIANWINPLLTNQIIQRLMPLLNKEKEGQAAFDQSILTALLPVVTNHLKHLNHTAPVDENKRNPQTFYQEQTDILFSLIFPNGEKDLLPILADFQLHIDEERITLLWQEAKTAVAAQLPKALDALFDKNVIVGLFNSLFEQLIDSFDKPKEAKAATPPSAPLTPADLKRQDEFDRAVGELMLEGARFIDLPMDRLENLPWLGKKIEKGTAHAIGGAMRKQFNGELLAKTLLGALTTLAKKKHVKVSEAEKEKVKANAPEKFQQLKRALAEKSVAFILRSIQEAMAHAADPIGNRFVRAFAQAVLWISSFVLFKIIFPILRLIGIEAMVINYLHQLIQRSTDKTIKVFSDPKLHEEAVFKGVEAFERVLS